MVFKLSGIAGLPVPNLRFGFEAGGVSNFEVAGGITKMVFRIAGGSPTVGPTQILHFSLVSLMVNLHTKFDLFSSNRFRNMERVPKCTK